MPDKAQTVAGRFVAVRPFFLRGKMVAAGETIELDDAAEITDLVGRGKAAPADAATQARLRVQAIVSWGDAALPQEIVPREPWFQR